MLVHDGARPLVTPALVTAVAEAVAAHGAAVPVVSLSDTVRRVGSPGAGLGEVVDRDGLVAAQTPQGAQAGSCNEPSIAFRRMARIGSPMRPPD